MSNPSATAVGEPGMLTMRHLPLSPLTPRESMPNGTLPNVSARIASDIPWTSLSMTDRVPSGVRSRGLRPVPPVVTMSDTSSASRVRAPATVSMPSATTTDSATVNPRPSRAATATAPDVSPAVPAATESDTVTTAAIRSATFPVSRLSTGFRKQPDRFDHC